MFIRGFSTNTFRYASLLNYRVSEKGIHSCIDEPQILRKLSEVLPISIYKPVAINSSYQQLGVREVDDFLPPEDKLRGVFLQKFCGKAAIFHALSSVAVELNADVFAKVINRGNLCGESMVVFFNWAIKQPNLCENIDAYHILLKALGRRKLFVHMVEMLRNMRDKGMNPNSETLFIVMDSYLRAHLVAKATKVFHELEEFGLKCDEEMLTVALKCFSQRSHVGVACSLFNKTKEKVQCDCALYNIMIGGWSKIGRVSEVEKILKVMVDSGVEPDCSTYGYVIEGFGRAGRVDDAVKIFEFLVEKENPLSVEVYNSMIFNYIANDDIESALKYYERMLSSFVEPNVGTYTRIILYFLKIRRVADAIEMFDKMLSRGLVPSMGTVTDFIEPLCQYGPPHAAVMIYKKARKVGCRISLTAYKLLLMRLARFGKCGMLLTIWDEMQESGYSSDMQVYEYIINGLCNTGKLETAVTLMEECIGKGLFPGKIICSKLKNKLMESNKVEMAYKLFLKLRNARLDENAQRYWRVKGWHF